MTQFDDGRQPAQGSAGLKRRRAEGTPHGLVNFRCQQLAASGGSGSGYTYTATGLPPGLSLNLQGLLHGMPTIAIGEPFSVDVTVTYSDGATGGQTYPLMVKAAANSGSVGSPQTASYFGQDITLTATFSATAAGSTPMAGMVSFYDGSTLLGTESFFAPGVLGHTTVSLGMPSRPPTISGTTSLTTSALAVGNASITAVYTGNANYSSATSQTSVSVFAARILRPS